MDEGRGEEASPVERRQDHRRLEAEAWTSVSKRPTTRREKALSPSPLTGGAVGRGRRPAREASDTRHLLQPLRARTSGRAVRA